MDTNIDRINEEAGQTNAFLGLSVSMSNDGEITIEGSYDGNDDGGSNIGQARGFENNKVVKTKKSTDFAYTFFHCDIMVLETELVGSDRNTISYLDDDDVDG